MGRSLFAKQAAGTIKAEFPQSIQNMLPPQQQLALIPVLWLSPLILYIKNTLFLIQLILVAVYTFESSNLYWNIVFVGYC